MHLKNLPAGMIDWSTMPFETHAGETGSTSMHIANFGDIQMRLVEYSKGYYAADWCSKGHIIHALEGEFVIDHQDGSRHVVKAGATYHVDDDHTSPHRVTCKDGAKAFIVE